MLFATRNLLDYRKMLPSSEIITECYTLTEGHTSTPPVSKKLIKDQISQIELPNGISSLTGLLRLIDDHRSH